MSGHTENSALVAAVTAATAGRSLRDERAVWGLLMTGLEAQKRPRLPQLTHRWFPVVVCLQSNPDLLVFAGHDQRLQAGNCGNM